MTTAEKDACLVATLLRYLNNQRLPKLFAIKARLDLGERLDPQDLRYLHEGAQGGLWVRHLCERHPDLTAICSRITALYKEITERALQNEELAH